MYRGGRPNRMARLLNGLWKRTAAAGLPPHRMQMLEVRGRRSGRLRSFPVVVADYEGERYLVAMLGEGVNWVSNVRAAGGQAVLRHGNRQAVHLEEVAAENRPPILKRYLQLAPGARAHIPVDPKAPVTDFDRVASRHPVFRIET
jgi:deazaflavin-dependent oxidoreductase (nitroreductase family)